MRREILVAIVASALLASAIAAPVAGSTADEESGESTLRVDLESDGDATVSLVTTYDLADEDGRAAFETLRDDEETQAELLERFADRMGSVANGVDDESMAVTGDSVAIEETDEEGTVTLSVAWTGLATVDGGELVLDEPFASGFETERRFVVSGPDGATVESATPEPALADGTGLVWESGTDLDGFELTLSLPADEPGSTADDGDDEADEEAADRAETTGDGTPGGGLVAAIAGIATATCLLRRRVA